MDKYQKFAELISDETKAKEVLSESIEETQANLKKHGMDFSIEELIEMAQNVLSSTESGELNEDSLENVSGGYLAKCATPILSKFAFKCGFKFAMWVLK